MSNCVPCCCYVVKDEQLAVCGSGMASHALDVLAHPATCSGEHSHLLVAETERTLRSHGVLGLSVCARSDCSDFFSFVLLSNAANTTVYVGLV